MGRNKKKRLLIVIGVTVVIFLMIAGYAGYITNVSLTAKYNVNENFDVKITNITTSNLGGHAINAETPSFTATSATFKTKLYLPGDYAEYAVTVTNAGNLDVYLKGLTPSSNTNDAIIFTNSGLTKNERLNANSTKTFTVRIEYDVNVTQQPTNLSEVYELNLNYEQVS